MSESIDADCDLVYTTRQEAEQAGIAAIRLELFSAGDLEGFGLLHLCQGPPRCQDTKTHGYAVQASCHYCRVLHVSMDAVTVVRDAGAQVQ